MVKKTSSSQKRGIHKASGYYKEFIRFSEKVRERIKQLREEKGLTQEQMQDFELNLRQFQRIESGDTINITLSNLFRIAKALGIQPFELLK